MHHVTLFRHRTSTAVTRLSSWPIKQHWNSCNSRQSNLSIFCCFSLQNFPNISCDREGTTNIISILFLVTDITNTGNVNFVQEPYLYFCNYCLLYYSIQFLVTDITNTGNVNLVQEPYLYFCNYCLLYYSILFLVTDITHTGNVNLVQETYLYFCTIVCCTIRSCFL